MALGGLFLVLLSAVLTMSANLMLRAGIDAAGGFSFSGPAQFFPALIKLFMQPMLVAGFVTYFIASIVWFRVVATQSLSVAYPTLVSLTFILVTAGAVILFGEPVSMRKLAGLAVILAGIGIVTTQS